MRRAAPRLVLALLAPLLAALAAEGLSRLVPGGSPTDTESALLWVAGGRPAFACSADGACWIDPGLARLDNPKPAFSRRPAPGTFRAACVGDSTTAGWPFHPRGGYPEWLAEILAAALPGRRVEVLNLGVHAWDGARIETVFDQALSLGPDALIVRLGYDDYQHFLLRRPRGGAWAAAALRARLFLLARSSVFRRLS